MDSRLALFCSVDEFWQEFAPRWHQSQIHTGKKHRQRSGQMHPSEMLTILILFQQSGYRTFKDFLHPAGRSADLTEQLHTMGSDLITKVRKPMTPRLLDPSEAGLLRRRALIATSNDQLKNSSQIHQTRHRSPVNFLVNLLCSLIAYCRQPRKPSLHLEWLLLPVA